LCAHPFWACQGPHCTPGATQGAGWPGTVQPSVRTIGAWGGTTGVGQLYYHPKEDATWCHLCAHPFWACQGPHCTPGATQGAGWLGAVRPCVCTIGAWGGATVVGQLYYYPKEDDTWCHLCAHPFWACQGPHCTQCGGLGVPPPHHRLLGATAANQPVAPAPQPTKLPTIHPEVSFGCAPCGWVGWLGSSSHWVGGPQILGLWLRGQAAACWFDQNFSQEFKKFLGRIMASGWPNSAGNCSCVGRLGPGTPKIWGPSAPRKLILGAGTPKIRRNLEIFRFDGFLGFLRRRSNRASQDHAPYGGASNGDRCQYLV